MTSPTRPLGSSGLDITTVGFGAWSGGAEAGEPAERLYFQRRGLARASHRERSGISAGPRRCPIGPPAAVLQQWAHPMPSQRNDLQHSALGPIGQRDRKSTRLNSSNVENSNAIFSLKKKIRF